MFVRIDLLDKKCNGIKAIVHRCAEEKWIRIVEKQNVAYLSKADAYKTRFILHLLNTGIEWEDIPRYLTEGYLYSVENPGH
jgi:hypothetical protein